MKLLASLSAGLMMAAAASVSAQASPITGTFNISVYQGNGSGLSTDPQEQANQVNPLITGGGVLIGSGTYTGDINFVENSGASNNDVTTFLKSAGGSLSAGFPAIGAKQLSNAT